MHQLKTESTINSLRHVSAITAFHALRSSGLLKHVPFSWQRTQIRTRRVDAVISNFQSVLDTTQKALPGVSIPGSDVALEVFGILLDRVVVCVPLRLPDSFRGVIRHRRQ